MDSKLSRETLLRWLLAGGCFALLLPAHHAMSDCVNPIFNLQHELAMGGGVMKHRRSKDGQSHSECEKCGLALAPAAWNMRSDVARFPAKLNLSAPAK